MNDFLFDLEVRHLQKEPVFVMGAGGSGIELLANLMRKYLRINFDTDFLSFLPIYNSAVSPGNFGAEPSLATVDELLRKLDCIRSWQKEDRFNFDLAGMVKGRNISGYQDIIDIILTRLTLLRKMSIWGYGDSSLISHIPTINNLFPGARYIHIVRDGRALIQGSRNKSPESIDVAQSASNWKTYLLRSEQLSRLIPEKNYLRLKYEFLMRHPDKAFFFLLVFLNIEDRGQQLMRFISNNIWREIKKENFDVWEKHLSADDLAVFERIAGGKLSEYGYKTEKKQRKIISKSFKCGLGVSNCFS